MRDGTWTDDEELEMNVGEVWDTRWDPTRCCRPTLIVSRTVDGKVHGLELDGGAPLGLAFLTGDGRSDPSWRRMT